MNSKMRSNSASKGFRGNKWVSWVRTGGSWVRPETAGNIDRLNTRGNFLIERNLGIKSWVWVRPRTGMLGLNKISPQGWQKYWKNKWGFLGAKFGWRVRGYTFNSNPNPSLSVGYRSPGMFLSSSPFMKASRKPCFRVQGSAW